MRGPTDWRKRDWVLWGALVTACGAVCGWAAAEAFAPLDPPRADCAVCREAARRRDEAEAQAAAARGERDAARRDAEAFRQEAAAAKLALSEVVRTAIWFPKRGGEPRADELIPAPAEPLPIPTRPEPRP